MVMTKAEVKQKVDYHSRKLAEYKKELERMETAFEISDMNKPFRKYTINDLQALLEVSQKAYEWSREEENRNATIYDYNLQAYVEDRVLLAK